MGMKLTSPVWRYGGKGDIWPWIVSHFPRNGIARYVEGFGGGGSVLLNIFPPYPFEVYNDLDRELTTIFRVLRDRPDELYMKLYLTHHSRAEYVKAIDFNPDGADDIERARVWFLKHRQSFAGKGIVARRGDWARSVKSAVKVKGWTRWIESMYWPVVERLRRIQIDCIDAIECFKKYDKPDTLHYLDPPYHPDSRQGSNEYGHLELSVEYHERLLQVLLDAKGQVALSSYHVPLYDGLLKDWTCIELEVQTHVPRQGRDRLFAEGKRTECLWLNPALVANKPHQLRLFRDYHELATSTAIGFKRVANE